MKRLKLLLPAFAALVLAVSSCKKDREEIPLTTSPAAADATAQNNQAGVEGKICGALQFNDAATKSRMAGMEQRVQAYISQHPDKGARTASTIVTVPVVFHVIYNLA